VSSRPVRKTLHPIDQDKSFRLKLLELNNYDPSKCKIDKQRDATKYRLKAPQGI